MIQVLKQPVQLRQHMFIPGRYVAELYITQEF